MGEQPIAAEQTAMVVERLATLISGGVVPDQAWRRVARAEHDEQDAGAQRGLRARRVWLRRPRSPRESTLGALARRAEAGGDVAAWLREHPDPTWRALGATWALALRTGAPLGQALRQLAAGFYDLGASAREVNTALAGPTQAARIVLVLPLVGLFIGAALGFDTFAVLTGSILGAACIAAGGVLMLAGWLWNRALVRRARRHPATPGFGLDLIAMVMLSGRSAGAAREAVAQALHEWRLEPSGVRRADSILRLAADAGVPAGELLRSEATLARARARADAAALAARLEVRLMLPLGACILPAFLSLGVAPLVIAVLQRTLH